MVMITPEDLRRYGDRGIDTFGTATSVRHAISWCNYDVSTVTTRMLGRYVIVEGIVSEQVCIERIREIASNIVGQEFVRIRVFHH